MLLSKVVFDNNTFSGASAYELWQKRYCFDIIVENQAQSEEVLDRVILEDFQQCRELWKTTEITVYMPKRTRGLL